MYIYLFFNNLDDDDDDEEGDDDGDDDDDDDLDEEEDEVGLSYLEKENLDVSYLFVSCAGYGLFMLYTHICHHSLHRQKTWRSREFLVSDRLNFCWIGSCCLLVPIYFGIFVTQFYLLVFEWFLI